MLVRKTRNPSINKLPEFTDTVFWNIRAINAIQQSTPDKEQNPKNLIENLFVFDVVVIILNDYLFLFFTD